MFCPNCGSQVNGGAAFCASCGKSVDGVVAPSSTPSFVPPKSPAPKRELPKINLSRKAKIYLAGALVLAIAGTFTIVKLAGVPTEANAKSFLVSESSVQFTAKIDKEPSDYTDKDTSLIGEECTASNLLDGYLQGSKSWALTRLQKRSDSQNYFGFNQQIIKLSSEEDAKGVVEQLTAAGNDSDCSSSSYSTSLISKYTYENPRSLSDAWGVSAEGVVIDYSSYFSFTISYSTSTSTSSGAVAVARRGDVVQVIYFYASDGGTSQKVSFADLKELATETLKRFAG
jgi:hypothetical protein